MTGPKQSLDATNLNTQTLTGAKQGRALLHGAYLGIVKDTNDVQRMGRIRVHIPELGGHPTNQDHWITCSYVSPFAGATPPNQTQDSKDIKHTQVSYGFWFPVPDIENEVIVMFLGGDVNKAIWIGCRFQQNMNQMVPGIAGSNTEEGFAPGAEYNKTNETRPSAPGRPSHPLHAGLKMQGLDKDQVRGVSTSSARRQGTSRAYGILTPRGTQMVIDDGLQHSAIPEQNESSDDYNASANKNPANQTISRNDDPEPTRTSEFIRFRTRGGTQILLSESDGMIYMATRNGQNWVELAPDGNIDIYSGAQVSIHSQGSINFVAQTDVNIEAGRNINLKARGGTSEHMSNGKGNIFIEASKNIHTKCGESMYSTIGKEKHVTVAEDYRIQSKFINQKTTDSYVLEVGKDQHINVVQNKIEEIGQTVQLQVAGTYSAEIQGETSFDFASFLSIRAASFSITGIDEGLSMSSTSSGLQIKSPQDIKMQATNVHIKGTPHISSGGDNNPADSTPSSPSFGSVGSPANPVTPTEATPPFVYALGDNAQYGTSIASRAPEHEPWQGHVVGSTSSHAPYTGPNETLAQTKARITAPPAGSAAYEGRATVATTGATAAITSAISSAIGNNRSGSTNPAASNINFDKIEADVKKFVATAVTGIANNVVGMKMSDQGKQYLCSWEYYVPFEYPDGEKNGKQLYSIGYGHSLQGNDSAFTLATMLAGLTEEEAFDLLSNTDIPRYEKDVRKQIKVSVRQHEFDALVDCAYNRGAFNPGLVDAINALNNNNREGVADGLLSSSATGGGDPNLISRRRSNVELFYTGKYNFNVSREELKGTGLRNFTYEQWIGDNLYRKWGRTIFPETTQGNKVLVQAYLAYNRSTDKDKFNLPDTLPLKDTLKPRLQGALKKSLADTLKVKDKLVALKDKLTN